MSRVNRIFPTCSLLYFFYLFTFTRAHLSRRRQLPRKEVLPTERLGVENGQNERRGWKGAVWALLYITATASASPPAVRGNIFQSFSIASSSLPFLGVSSHAEVFLLSFVQQLLELTYLSKAGFLFLCHLKINCTSFSKAKVCAGYTLKY